MRRLPIGLTLALLACSEPPVTPMDGGADAGADACAPGRCGEDPCDALECPDPRQLCVASEGTAECRCPSGTHVIDGRCEDDTSCTETTCGIGGECTDVEGTLSCECADGYDGDRCEECAAGYLRDPAGLCDDDLCDPSPCEGTDHPTCVVVENAAQCACGAGTHEEGGTCVPDLTCMPDTCGGRGTCEESDEGVSCMCDDSFAGRFCEGCDEGWHDDGAGGCTTDVCLPDPCTAAPFTRCLASPEGASCECELGFHRMGAGCAADEVCSSASCGGHGACTVVDGTIECECDAEYDGDECELCGVGYHDDGEGECTDDVCRPSPCTAPNRTTCVSGATGASCECDAGYHDDGVGRCTTDPCLPHPCGDQACRVDTSGAAECFTPVCDDGNPCTSDTPTAAGCVYAPLPNGTACSSTACVTGQTCGAGACGGGTAVSCADTNPCTVDACDPIVGCTFEIDTTLAPDDGMACTVGSCASGVPVHTPSNAACDDSLFCTGVEQCAPTNAGRDARGCIRTSVPVQPGRSSPCAYYAACDEATDSFPLVTLPAGSACNDGIACTSGDVCVTTGGACAGAVTSSCGVSGSCGSTEPWSPTIDIPTASVIGAMTLDGAAPPASVSNDGYGTATLWAVARDTGVRHRLGELGYVDFISGGGYRLGTGDGVIDARLLPGVYDLLLQRGDTVSSSGSGDRWVSLTRGAVPIPSAWRVVREAVVLGPGANTLNVDIPTSIVTGAITLDGAPPPASVSNDGYGTATVWAVARDTGARHRLGELGYVDFISGGGYRLGTGDGVIDARLVPGTYDLLLQRGDTVSSSGSGDRWVSLTRGAVPIPSAWRVIREGVVIPAGASTLSVDIPTSIVTGAITLDGAPPPASVSNDGYGTATVWAVARDTGARHHLGELGYVDFISGGGYRLGTGDGVIDARLVPGTYDLLLQRGDTVSSSGSGDRWVSLTRSAVPIPSAWRVIREGVVIPAGASTLSVDIPTSTVTGAITLDGAPPPASVSNDGYGTATVWAVARDTGARHRLGELGYVDFISGGGYRLGTGDGVIDARLVPGTYDLLLQRGDTVSSSGSGDRWVSLTRSAVPIPSAWRVIRGGVVIAAGASTLNVDIPTSIVTGAITLDGAPPPASVSNDGYGTATVWAVARDTGARHRLGELGYVDFISGGGYRLGTGDGVIDARLVPGTYDILLQRGDTVSSSGSGDRWVSLTRGAVPIPSAWRVIDEAVVLGAGASTLNVDIPTTVWSGAITLDGAPPPASVTNDGYGTATLWAVSRDTGVRHRLGELGYVDFISGGGYRLGAGDAVVDARLVPGIYDILFQRGDTVSSSGSGDRWVSLTRSAVPIPSGWRYLRQCVLVP